MSAPFSMAAWRDHCETEIRPKIPFPGQAVPATEQCARFERLIGADPDVERAWRNFASDVKDGRAWTLALSNVLNAFLRAPTMPAPMTQKDLRRIKRHAEKLRDELAQVHAAGGYFRNAGGLPVILCAGDDAGGLGVLVDAIDRALDGRYAVIPAPGKQGRNAEPNWIAIHLRDSVVPLWFARPHHEDIARLINAVLLSDLPLTAKSVAQLKSIPGKNFAIYV